ncbi:rCG62226 [Rattus norvegicus]|uniref:RCG62226 n=1 Tax=Rattus norvegicus TaxID=10116 RepID=A6HAP2_RAT|nr:rCG62226 [Rattus norvegicus]
MTFIGCYGLGLWGLPVISQDHPHFQWCFPENKLSLFLFVSVCPWSNSLLWNTRIWALQQTP